MPETTPHSKITYAIPTDKVKLFPTEVSKVGAETIDTILFEKILTFKGYSGAANLHSGEFALQEKSGETFTLPAVGTANQFIGVYCGPTAASCKVTVSGVAFIYGDFISGVATITLTSLQHVWLYSNGSIWQIVAGEPKREQTYVFKEFTKAVAEAGVEPSATRPAMVNLACTSGSGGYVIVVGGKSAGIAPQGTVGTASVYVPPGQKWTLAQQGWSYTLLL
jgi:hypothetical protein